jgi:hypothetical protein
MNTMTPDLPAALIELPRLMVMEFGIGDWILNGILFVIITFLCGFPAKLLILGLIGGAVKIFMGPARFKVLEGGALLRVFFACWAMLAPLACTAWLLNNLYSADKLIGTYTEDEGRLTVVMTERQSTNKSGPSCLIRARQAADGRLVASTRSPGRCPHDQARRDAIRQALPAR